VQFYDVYALLFSRTRCRSNETRQGNKEKENERLRRKKERTYRVVLSNCL